MSDFSLLSTAGIQDPQVRNFLDRLVQAWDQRMGGSDPMVRRSDVDGLAVTALAQALSGGAGSNASAIQALTDYIRKSLLYQVLEGGINIGDLQALRNELPASVSREEKTRINGDSVLASAINRIWSYIGGSTAVIEEGSLATANASSAVATKWASVVSAVTDPNTGNVSSAAILQETRTYASSNDSSLNAIYSVRAQLDVNGNTVVGGFGLAATSGAGSAQGPSISFGVMANTFWLAPPGGGYDPATEYGSNLSFPFIVVTTPTTINGVTYPAGVYMKKAFIGQAAIDSAEIKDLAVKSAHIDNLAVKTAHIDDLSVDTLKIADQAVTVPQSAYTSTFASSTGTSLAQTLSVTSSGAPALLVFGAHIFCSTYENLFLQLQRDGTTIFQAGPFNGTTGSAVQGEGMETATIVDTPSAGSHTYDLYVGGGGGDTVTMASRCISYIEVKK